MILSPGRGRSTSFPIFWEAHHGQFAGLSDSDIAKYHPDSLRARQADKYHWRFPDGESYADGDARARRALGSIAAASSERPLIVSHEMIGRMLLRNLLDLDVSHALGIDQPHNVIDVIDVVDPRRLSFKLIAADPDARR